MTDGDRELLNDLRRLGEALGPFSGGIFIGSLSVIQQLDFSYQLIGLAGQIRARVEKTRVGNGAQGVDGDEL